MGDEVAVPGVLGEIELVEPGHFDGWSAADLATWVEHTAPSLDMAERRVLAYRAGVGLAIWNMRQEMQDGPYGERLALIATRSHITVRTLHRWREAAESYYKLTPVSRALGQRERHLRHTVTSGRPPLIPPPAAAKIQAERPPAPAVATPVPPPAVAGYDDGDTVPCPRCQGSGTITVTKTVVPGCPHPLVKRLGTRCTDCGQQVGTAGTIGGR